MLQTLNTNINPIKNIYLQDNKSYQKEKITIESLIENLEEYNKENNDDLLFIDILEKISFSMSASEKIQISNDGNKLLEKIDKEISKMSGYLVYDNSSFEVSYNDKEDNSLSAQISKLKSQLNSETDEDKKILLLNEIFLLETQTLNAIV